MKVLFTAIALTIAVPAAAQTGQLTADPHAGHGQQADHSRHSQAGQAGQASHDHHGQAGHEGHKNCCEHMTADGKKMECCGKAKTSGAKMECCEKHARMKGAADGHAGHDMSKH
ncbi:MAG TPA: hypothetical protein VNT77_06250 [Allosphingosinicella sp.]|nr:hypothetical protein [Allosphingosinicella sp.]